MNATQRYSNPVVTDDGAGTFFATTGSNTGGAPGAANGVLGNRSDTQTIPLYGIGVTWDAAPALRFVANAGQGFTDGHERNSLEQRTATRAGLPSAY
jgi:hypothetical protein